MRQKGAGIRGVNDMRAAMRRGLSALVLGLAIQAAPSPAAAQDIAFAIAPTERCLAGADDAAAARACIGTAADACMSATPHGSTTMGATACLDAELRWWDARLNAAYKRLLQQERREDEEFPPPPGVIGQAEALRQMQRAWIAFRDATCAYEYAQWSGGTGGTPAHVSCLLRLTAEQALYLENSGAAG